VFFDYNFDNPNHSIQINNIFVNQLLLY